MTMASVFSGIGGEMVAATMMGWDVEFFCEKNPFGHKVLSYWYPNAEKYEDITTTDFSKWRGKINVLTGGFPCQPFSYAGKRKGADDDRYLWPFMYRAIDQIQPDWIVAENVGGILTMVEQSTISRMENQGAVLAEDNGVRRYQQRGTFTLQRICRDLQKHGYTVQPVLIPACAVGAPHRRDRVFIVAHRNDITDTNSDGRPKKDIRGEGGERVPDKKDYEQSEPIFDRSAPAYSPCGGAGTPGQSDGSACNGCNENQQPSQRGTETERTNGRSPLLWDAANTTDPGIEGMRQERQDEVHGYGETGSAAAYAGNDGLEAEKDSGRESQFLYGATPTDGSGRTPSDTDSGRVSGFGNNGSLRFEREAGEPMPNVKSNGRESIDGIHEETAGCGRWDSFPTVSPVHRGNDGLPFNVDDLTISFSKWRTESLKAYGNAIVPQVMYEIFRAIEIVEMS